jgi:hypothetical protein
MAGNVVNPQAKAKLTAAGASAQQADQLAQHCTAAGCDPAQVAELAKLAPAFNWGALLSLVSQYGPQILGALLQVFGTAGGGAGGAGAGGQQP